MEVLVNAGADVNARDQVGCLQTQLMNF